MNNPIDKIKIAIEKVNINFAIEIMKLQGELQ